VTAISLLTPAGRAALSTFAVRGPRAWEVVQRLFRPRKGTLPAVPEPGRFFLGRVGGDVADEVVLAVKQVVPVVWLELHTHGGGAVTDYVLDLFRDNGVAEQGWEDFLRQKAPNPFAAEALIALAAAPTMRTAAILLDQVRGAFARAVDAIRQAGQRDDTATVLRDISDLARYANLGRHLTTPWRVAIAGAPNVGKSTLVNALAGFQRSIVSPTPGTTRDVVTTRIALDGWPVELADTAGLRAGAESLEEEGIRLARHTLAEADLCLWVLDANAEPTWPDTTDQLLLLVVNKIDLTPAWDLTTAAGALRVSARTGEGLPELCTAIANRLVPDAPLPGAAVPFTAQLCDLVEEARRAAVAGRVAEAGAILDRLIASESHLPKSVAGESAAPSKDEPG
jgi:tRNA modification GTPase